MIAWLEKKERGYPGNSEIYQQCSTACKLPFGNFRFLAVEMDKDMIIMFATRALSDDKQDAIDMAIINMLSDPKEVYGSSHQIRAYTLIMDHKDYLLELL